MVMVLVMVTGNGGDGVGGGDKGGGGDKAVMMVVM